MALRARSLLSAETATLDALLKDLSERAHQETVRSATPDIAATLQRLFGQRIVAFMTGVEDPKAVGRWARGERTPRDDTEQRLREAFQIDSATSDFRGLGGNDPGVVHWDESAFGGSGSVRDPGRATRDGAPGVGGGKGIHRQQLVEVDEAEIGDTLLFCAGRRNPGVVAHRTQDVRHERR